MKVFPELPGNRHKSGIKGRVSMTSPDRKEASCKGSPWEREACFRKVLYGCAPGKQDAAAFGGRSRHQFWTAGEEKKAGSTPGNSYGCLAGIGRHGSLLSPGCFICWTGMKAGKTPLNGPGRVQKGKDGGLPAMPMNKRVLDTSGGECFPLEEPVHPVLRGHVSPMERIFRKFGKIHFIFCPVISVRTIRLPSFLASSRVASPATP